MKRKTVLYILAGIFISIDVAAVIFAVVMFGYGDKWYPRTTVNGIDVSGKTLDDTANVIQDYINTYSITISGRDDAKLTIKGTDIDLKLVDDNGLSNIFDDEHSQSLPIKRMFTSSDHEFPMDVEYNADKLKAIVEESDMVAGSDTYKINEPVSAYVEYSMDDKKVEIVPAQKGNKIISDNLIKYLEEEIKELETDMNIDDEAYRGVYRVAEFTEKSGNIVEEYQNINSMLYQWVSWDMGSGIKETITPDDIKKWISVNKSGEVKIDKDAMSEWIEQFCLKYKTVGAERTFTTHDGKQIKVEGGDYGWRIDYDATVEDAYEILTGEKDFGIVEEYLNDQTEENKKALTVTCEPEYSSKGFKMNYSNPTQDWDTKNYSEVDLSDQKVYVYKDGKLAHECICVTGLASDPERATRKGCYNIKEKKEDYVLKGADYTTPTKFWIRIMWSGTGYHYMNRRDWKNWTNDIYKSRGSHGCINLQYDDAKTLYELISYNDAVFIHE